MKRIITTLLTMLLLCLCTAFTVSAQDNGVMFSFSYAEKNNGIVDKKQTALLEKATVDGIQALKITPTPATAQSNEVRIDCYSLSYDSKQLKDAKYIAVMYRYDGEADLDQSMAMHLFKSGGALTSAMTVYSAKIKGGEWQLAVFDISAISDILDLSADKKFTQFHFWPYGKDTAATSMTSGQVMYIGDIMFCNKAPTGIKLPELSTPRAPQTSAESSAPTKAPSLPGAPSEILATENGYMFGFTYAEKHNGIVDKKQTATLDPVTVDGKTALQIVPTPDTALSNEIRIDCYTLSYTPQQLYGAKYMTVEYKYTGSSDFDRPMTVQLFKTDGALKSSMMLTSKNKIKCGDWAMAVFDVSAISANLDFSEDKKFSQFHFWPYGRDTRVSELTVNQAIYIGDITFHSKAPEGSGIVEKPSEPLLGDENGFLVGFNYQDENNGIVDGKKTAVLEKVTENGEKALKIVPSPDTALASQIALDCYNLDFTQNEIANARYMAIKYKYIAPADAKTSRMTVRIFGGSSRAIISTIEVEALSETKVGEWTVAMFDVSAIGRLLNKSNPMAIMSQFHFYPFGKFADVYAMNGDYTMYVSDIGFYTVNPDPTIRYTVAFKKGHPEAVGENPEILTLKRGDKYTIPEMPYSLTGGTFLGWKSSTDGKLYMPGEQMTLPDANVVYSAQFSVARQTDMPYKALDFTVYNDGSVNKLDNITVTEERFMGKNVVKIAPVIGSTSAGKNAVVDGYSYAQADIDLGVYKYLVITYYLEGEMPNETKIYANILKGGVLTKNYGALSAEKLTPGKWNFALLDFSGTKDLLVPNLDAHILSQMHLYVFDGTKPAEMTGNEALYINSLMFFKEKPELFVHESYMKGYDGGVFKPQGNMTRAEACTIVARLAAGSDELVPNDKTTAFADVASDKWYYKYVSYVESLGYLGSYSGNFEPDKPITRAEFVELVYNMGLLRDSGKNGVFTDVAQDHPRATVIAAAGKAGLVNGYDNGDGTFSFRPDNTISRAEVVKVINNAYQRSITKDQISEEAKYSFADVDGDFWAYADIMEATIAHVEGKNGWIFCMVSPYTVFGKTNENLDYAAGEAYLTQLDGKSEEKKNAVINTPNMDVSAFGGKKYYISNNGNDENDGLTPETAWKTIGRMVKGYTAMKAGDVVLFERGGLWRERFSSKSGITYTAYGTGVKPMLYGSPENGANASMWTLLDGTTNIWVYGNKLPDVGAIMIDGGKIVGLKELPDLSGNVFYTRNTGKAKLFDVRAELDENYEFFSEIPSTAKTSAGKLYFRCDEGNPGELFSQIEFNTTGSVIANGDATDTHFDNLCIMYTGTHGISSHSTNNMTVTNCEIAYIGGAIMSYDTNGRASRLGNGIEIYGSAKGFTVHNNYIRQCYDAGATHQYSSGGTENISMNDIVYSDNIIEDCIYSIEYFNGVSENDASIRDGRNIAIRNNILRRAGYGWGNQRPDANVCAHIKSWTHNNECDPGTFVIENNIFDRSSSKLVQTVAAYDAWCPVYNGNTYIQYIDGGLCEYKSLDLDFNCYAEQAVKYELCDDAANVFFLPGTYKYNGYLSR